MSGINQHIQTALDAMLSAWAASMANTVTSNAITVDASDHSFNCSGLFGDFKRNDVVTVSGCSKPGNNGAFTVNSASTDKLITDGALANEAAGASITMTRPWLHDSRIAWSNRSFDSNSETDIRAGTTWVAAYLLPGIPEQIILGPNGGMNRHTGIYQVSCFMPEGEGVTSAWILADSVATCFRRGQGASSGGVTVRILRSGSGPARIHRIWFHIPVSVYYWADADNE